MEECPLTGANRALTTASSQNNQPVVQTAKRDLRACTTLQEQWSTCSKGYTNGGKQLLMLSVEKCGKNSSYRRKGLWLRKLNPSAPSLILQIKSRKLFVTLPNLNLCKVRLRMIIAQSLRSPHKGNNPQAGDSLVAFPKPWTVVLWELNTATKLASQRLQVCPLQQPTEGRLIPSLTCVGSAVFWSKSEVTSQDQTPCAMLLCFLSMAPHPPEEKKSQEIS